MLSLHRTVLRPSLNTLKFLFNERNVFVMSHEKRRNSVPKKESQTTKDGTDLLRWAYEDNLRKLKEQEIDHQKKLLELKDLTNSLASYMRQKENGGSSSLRIGSSVLGNKEEELRQGFAEQATPDHKKVIKNSKFEADEANLNTPAIDLPSKIQERLGPATQYLVHKDNQYWKLVMLHLKNNEGLSGVTSKEVAKLVRAVPNNQILTVFPIIETLMEEANILKTTGITNAYLKKLVSHPKIDIERLSIIENTVEELRKKTNNRRLNTDTYEALIEAYGKTSNIQKLENVMIELKKHEITPSPRIYSSILSTSVYQTKDHKQAVQLFDLMKFLAGCMAPKTREYRDIIVSYINNDDIEKALDLVQEMREKKISLDQKTLVALARGCSSRLELKLKAWDFIFEIYEAGLKPAVGTVEYMLYLAAKDGDLSLSRALYQQLIKLNAFSPRALGFLLIAYASFDVVNSSSATRSICHHETGRRFRKNILEKVNFEPDMSNVTLAIPFIPKVTLTTNQEILSESSAIIAHSLLVNREAVTPHNVNTFLNIAAKLGSLEEFKDRFDQFTYLDLTGAPKTRLHRDNEDKNCTINETKVEIIEEDTETKTTGMLLDTKSPILNRPEEIFSGVKTPRCTYTYTIALKAAAKHKNYEFAQSVWEERGLFRKTNEFTRMSRREKDELDFIVAATMVHCLTEMNLLDDALAILVSTEYQFRWTWKELMPLHRAAVDLGYDKVTRTVRGIASRAQIRYEGKIRKKDFKLHILRNKHL